MPTTAPQPRLDGRDPVGPRVLRRRVVPLLVLTALLCGITLAPPASAAPTCAAGTTLNVVAHQDDDLLFLNPAISRDITRGLCVRTVYVSSGDNNSGAAYWQARESGILEAYSSMAGATNAWSTADAGVAGHPITVRTLTARPEVSVAFLRLPDGQDGGGNSSNSYQSLQKLYQGTIPTIRTVDGSSSYTLTDLVGTLTGLMTSYAPQTIRTQDFLGSYGDGDHSDHHSVAYLVRSAHLSYAAPHELIAYRDYEISNRLANVTGADLQAKTQAFLAYARYDALTCGSPVNCSGNIYEQWLSRNYPLTTETGGGAAGIDLAMGRPATASSTEVPSLPASSANDGSRGTRWASGYSDGQWWQVDLGAARALTGVEVSWEAAYASRYQIQTSTDGTTWTTAATVSPTAAGTQKTTIAVPAARYVRIVGVTRATSYGISLWDVRVFGSPDPVATTPAPVTPAPSTPASTDLSTGRPSTASSVETTSFPAAAANDGSATTRWSSTYSDGQWWQVDLGTSSTVTGVETTWEAAYASRYQIQTSTDGASWSTAATVTATAAGTQRTTTAVPAARYVRILGVTRATGFGVSLIEVRVLGYPSTSPAPTLPAGTDVSTGKPASASSVEGPEFPAGAANDGSSTSRWASDEADGQWWQVDLGVVRPVGSVEVSWEAAYASRYQIQTSTDGATWTTAATVTPSSAGTQTSALTGQSGRYVRVLGVTRATPWGLSIWTVVVRT